MQYITGTNDGKIRKTGRILHPAIPRKRFGLGKVSRRLSDSKPIDHSRYSVCHIELSPGKFVTQLIRNDRIEASKEPIPTLA